MKRDTYNSYRIPQFEPYVNTRINFFKDYTLKEEEEVHELLLSLLKDYSISKEFMMSCVQEEANLSGCIDCQTPQNRGPLAASPVHARGCLFQNCNQWHAGCHIPECQPKQFVILLWQKLE